MGQRVREEIVQEPRGGAGFWFYSIAGAIVMLIGLFFVLFPSEPTLRFTGLGQVSVGLGMVLWGLSQVLSPSRMALVVGLRSAAVVVLIVGIAAALLLLLLV